MTRTATSATAEEVLDYGPVEDRTTKFDGGYTVNWTSFREDVDMAPVLAPLPGGRCSCPHWGQVLSGRVVVHYEDHDDVIEAGAGLLHGAGARARGRGGHRVPHVQPHRGARRHRGGDQGGDAAPVAGRLRTPGRAAPGRPAPVRPRRTRRDAR